MKTNRSVRLGAWTLRALGVAAVCMVAGVSQAQTTQTFTYDVMGRIRTSTYPGGSSTVHYVYDASGNRTFMKVGAANTAPNAANDNITIIGAGTYSYPDFRTNDTDPESDTLTILSITQPGMSGVIIRNMGTYVQAYSLTNQRGTTSVDYTLTDTYGNLDTATVAITVKQRVRDSGGTLISGYVNDNVGATKRVKRTSDNVIVCSSSGSYCTGWIAGYAATGSGQEAVRNP